VWLGEGPYGRGHEKDVLKALGLDAWSEGEIEQCPTYSPPAVRPDSEAAVTLRKFTEACSSLEDTYFFRVHAGPTSGGLVALFLLGHLKDEGWGGLVGMGVWT